MIILVESTGIPINENEKETIFGDRIRGYYAEKYDKIGTGQGLYISKQIMKGFNGDIIILKTIDPPFPIYPPDNLPKAKINIFQITLPEAFYE